MSILITGGAGYIGSHTAIELIEENYDVIVVDNLCNSSIDSIHRIETITNKKVTFYKVDLLDKIKLKNVFKKHEINAVIHFAGYKAVEESVLEPLRYYENNIAGTINLCETMKEHNVNQLIFSSSATVYGFPEKFPITEESPTEAINPYGYTKLVCEDLIKDLSNSNPELKSTILRYFNPVGAHPSGRIGERPNGIPNNLMPYINQVATGELEYLKVYGDDYPTKDGTGIRDYIHVVDLAKGHIAALKNIQKVTGVEVFNLGTGIGYSVLEVINAFEKVTEKRITYKIVDKRTGDVAISFADTTKANKMLNWKAEKDLEDMCRDSFHWQINLMNEKVFI